MDMHLNHHLRQLAVATASAAALLAGITPPAASAATAPPALYTAPAVEGFSPQYCGLAAPNVDQCYLYSYNWAGYYAVENNPPANTPADSFTSVRATFSVPAVNCASGSTGYVSHWVGLGGEWGDNSLEAAGVTAQCAGQKASYEAFWDTYSKPQTDGFAVKAGDSITAEVVYATSGADKGRYRLAVWDKTTGKKRSVRKKCAASACLNATADVISSAPLSTATLGPGNVLPLADYGTSSFTGINIKDTTGQSGSFTSGNWNMIFQGSQIGSSGAFIALPSALESGGQGFTATWQNAS